MSTQIIIYTDGGADPNPGYGGWAALLIYGSREKILTGNAPDTTNNRMELTAACEALRALKRPCQVTLYTDSNYVKKGISEWIEKWSANGWKSKGKPIQNVDLWQRLAAQTERHQVDWQWVRGHAGNLYNERVDKLARQARLAITPVQIDDPNMPKLFLRGTCKGNPGPGSWGIVAEQAGETRQLSGSVPATTNNRMELLAAIEALKLVDAGIPVQLITTSDYLFQGATKWIIGWRRRNWQKRDGKPVANADLWQILDAEMGRRRLIWINAKGEQSDKFRQGLDEAGKLAKNAQEIV